MGLLVYYYTSMFTILLYYNLFTIILQCVYYYTTMCLLTYYNPIKKWVIVRDGLLIIQERQTAKDVKQTIPLAGCVCVCLCVCINYN